MTKKIRYSLIAVGFTFFLIAAPLMVLYVGGITYDFAAKSFVKTGILAVSVNPSDAAIYLDGKLKRQNQGDVKFLVPGAYQVQIKKTGYSDWSKRLNVEAGQVTWASPAYSSVYLFLKNPPVQTLAPGVLDFYARGKNLFYLTAQSAIVTASDNFSSQQVYPLPKSVTKILAYDDSGKNFALAGASPSNSVQTLLIFSQDSGGFTDISSMFTDSPKIQFDQNGRLYALSNSIFYSVNLQNKTKTAVLSGIKSFYFQGTQLYYIQQTATSFSLFVSPAPFSQGQLLVAGLPDIDPGDLFVTFEKEIFLLADSKLYLASSGMRQISDNISGFYFNPNDSFLSIIHSGEFDYYDPLASNLNFVTRSSEPLTNPRVLTSVGNAFFLQGNRLLAIELDARDNQNQYQLYQGADIQKFFIDDAGKNVLLLDSGELKSLVIR
jgi:PEGA domain